MPNQPWVSGPSEILQHGLSLLEDDSDVNRRIAIILIDNAVELIIKTYLSLPKRITGISISRKDYEEIKESFPKLLDAVEQYGNEKINDINLGEIEWYHRLRNELYHQGNGLTVERAKVEVYAELARLLFRNLFGVEIVPAKKKDNLAFFLEAWVELEQTFGAVEKKYLMSISDGDFVLSPFDTLSLLVHERIITDEIGQEIHLLQQLRNKIIHGECTPSDISKASISRISEITKLLKELSAQVS